MNPDWRLEDDPEGVVLVGPGFRRSLPYSREFLAELAAYRRGDELIDEVLRSEHPPYIFDRLRVLLQELRITEWRVLDFGCGAGASAVSLARLGIPHVVGIDIVNDYARIWRRRLAEAGFPDVGDFVQAGDTLALPFRDGQFDAAFLNGLVEHLLPEEREVILREVWRSLRSGGYLVLTETPNRWFPRNSHTKLWFSEWIPLGVAARLAARLGPRRDFPTRNRTAIYRTGIRGASVRQIARALGNAAVQVPVSDELVAMEFQLPRNPLQTARAGAAGRAWGVLRGVAGAAGIDVRLLSPHLNLLFRKR